MSLAPLIGLGLGVTAAGVGLVLRGVGATALLAAAKAWAWLNASTAVTPDHVQTMLMPVWRHRLQLRPDAQMEGVSADAVLQSVVQQTRVPI